MRKALIAEHPAFAVGIAPADIIAGRLAVLAFQADPRFRPERAIDVIKPGQAVSPPDAAE